MSPTIVLPPPLPAKKLSAHARRAARAFERVHQMLEAKATAVSQRRAKKPRRAA